MDFYLEWEKNLHDIEKNKEYINQFLSKTENSLKVFNTGTTDELVYVCKFLLELPINNFIYCINENIECTTDAIIQYSNLEHAIVDVPRVLKFQNGPLTFSELGKIIIKAKEDGACKKYGENHAKVAYEMSMVNFERKSSIVVANNSFGNFSVGLSNNDRIELVKRLALRNEFIQKLIYLAKNGLVNYMDIACEILSESTAIRRKPNVRQLVNLILKDTEIINNIVW